MSPPRRRARAGAAAWAGLLALLGGGCFLVDERDLLDWGACPDSGLAAGPTGAAPCGEPQRGASGGAAPGGDAAGAGRVDSCAWTAVGICVELEGYDDTDGWCTDIAAQYLLDTVYATAPCPLDARGSCWIPAPEADSDFPAPVTVYFYSTYFGDPASSCAQADGAYTPG